MILFCRHKCRYTPHAQDGHFVLAPTHSWARRPFIYVPDVIHDDTAGEALDAAGDGHIVRLKVVVTLEHVRRCLVLRNV